MSPKQNLSVKKRRFCLITTFYPPYHSGGCGLHVYHLANLLAGRGELAEAVAYYRRTLEINPEAVEAHNNLAVAIYRLGRKEEAVAHLREAMRIDPEDPAAYYNMGIILLKEGHPDQSIRYLERVLELRPGHEGARRALNSARKKAAEPYDDEDR